MERDEEHRNKWAAGLTFAVSAIIFTGFAFYRGFISFDLGGVIAEIKPEKQTASVVSVESAPSPIENSKEIFIAAFEEINNQYQQFKKSVSNVLVPFVTGIEVYERK